MLYLIASGRADFSLAAGFASNGYAEHSPRGYSLGAGLVSEVVMTVMFLIGILGATHKSAPVGFAGVAIGLALTLIHLVSIPVTNTSVNPARSTGPALFVGGWALRQLWLFWIAPIVGAALAGFAYKAVLEGQSKNQRSPDAPAADDRQRPTGRPRRRSLRTRSRCCATSHAAAPAARSLLRPQNDGDVMPENPRHAEGVCGGWTALI